MKKPGISLNSSMGVPDESLKEQNIICNLNIESNGSYVTQNQTTDKHGGMYCDVTWDGATCWPRTRAGQARYLPCPKEVEGYLLNSEKNATRFCHENGTWELRTDYSKCEPLDPVNQPEIIQYSESKKNLSVNLPAATYLTHSDDFDNLVSRLIYCIGFILSIIALLLALFILIKFRNLHCTRNTIHCHLMVTFLLKNIFWIVLNYVLPRLAEHTENSDHSVSKWTCKIFVGIFNYLQLTNFFWMHVEGLYLHSLVIRAYGATSSKLFSYCIYGWGLPFLFLTAWMIAKIIVEKNSDCWLPAGSKVEYIITIPIFCVLIINLLILIRISYQLVIKLRQSHSLPVTMSWRAAKSTLVLFPLLGITYILLITNPTDSIVSRRFFLFFNSILQSTQGLLVAVFYCFLNREVQREVVFNFNRWRDVRAVRIHRMSNPRSEQALSIDSIVSKLHTFVQN